MAIDFYRSNSKESLGMSNLKNCSKLYRQKYYKFSEIFNKASPIERRDLMLNCNIVLLPEFWNSKFRYEHYGKCPKEMYQKLMERAFFDFYSLKVYYNKMGILTEFFGKKPFNKLMSAEFFERTRTGIRNYCYRLLGREHCKNTLFDILTFPHKNLKEALESNKEYSGSFTTPRIRQTYQKSQKLFEKITAAKEDPLKWFQYLLESNDDRFIIQNVEARIAEEPTNKDLWKLYIEFLKEKDTEAANEVYYRYRHFFLDDNNTFGLQSNFKILFQHGKYLDNAKFDLINRELPWIINKPTPIFYNFENIYAQIFPFKATFMSYIIKNAKPETLQKLYESSKYFFAKIQKPLCHTFMIQDKTATTYYYNSLMINKDDLNFEGIQSIYICHVIIIELWHYTIHDPQNLILSNIIPKLKYLDLRILKINRQNISTSDYEFFTDSGNIEKIVFHGRILDEKKNLISLENIFKPLSKATDIELQTKVTITPNSWKILVSNKKEFKTNFIYFPDCDSIDYFDFIEYLLHNCADNSHVVYPHVANGIEMENGIRGVVENAKQETNKFFPKIHLQNYYAGMPKFVLFESYL